MFQVYAPALGASLEGPTMRHLTVPDVRDMPAEQVAIGTARLLLDIAAVELENLQALLAAAQAAHLAGAR